VLAPEAAERPLTRLFTDWLLGASQGASLPVLQPLP
jgi:hypothetical protein